MLANKFQFMWSKVKVSVNVHIKFFITLPLMITNHATLVDSRGKMTLLLFWSQIQGQTTDLHLGVVHSIFYEPSDLS